MTVGAHIAGGGRAALAAGPTSRELPALDLDPAAVAGLEVRGDPWGSATVDELTARHEVLGLVVVHRGRLAFERYGAAGGPAKRNLNFSITKSFTGTLAAHATNEGRLDRTALVGDLIGELAATGFADATVADLADMTAAIGYDEDYDDAASPSDRPGVLGFGDYMATLGLDGSAPAGDRPASIRDLLVTVGAGDRPHGEAFAYATPVTDTLGWLLERADDRDGADGLGRAVGRGRRRARRAARTRDPAGTALMGAGLAMTTRDLARFGVLVADAIAGRSPAGVLDGAVLDTIRDNGDPDAFQRGGHYAYLEGYSYRDQWWLPGGSSRPLSAWGIHGQVLWIDPDASVVIAYHCGGPLPSEQRRDLEQDALCRAIVEASSAWA